MAWASQKGELGVQMAARQRSGRGHHQGEQRRHHSHARRLPGLATCRCASGCSRCAAADITKAANNGATPMFIACMEGHLSVCKG